MTNFFEVLDVCRVGIVGNILGRVPLVFCAFLVLLCCASFMLCFCATYIGPVRFDPLFFILFCTSYVQFLILLSLRYILNVCLVVCSWCAGTGFGVVLLLFVAFAVAII